METVLHILPPAGLLSAFVVASLVLALTPGPAVLYIVARTLADGRRSGLASVAGVAIGNFLNALGAALGLAVLFAWSSAAFTVVKLAGAAWLLWMGWQLITQRAAAAQLPVVTQLPARRVFRDGVLVAVLNPKTTLFFAAFLPQFMTPGGPHSAQSVALGAVFVLIAGCTDAAYVMCAAPLAPRLQRAAKARVWSQRGAGAALVALGLLTATSQRPGR